MLTIYVRIPIDGHLKVVKTIRDNGTALDAHQIRGLCKKIREEFVESNQHIDPRCVETHATLLIC